MAEVECFAIKLNTEECIRRRNEIVYDTKNLKGFVGIHADNTGAPFQYFVFKTRAERDAALEKFKGIYATVKKEHRTLYIDEQFLSDSYVQPPLEDMFDDDFGQMIKEIKQKFREEIQAEFDKKITAYTAEIQKLKAQNKRLISENTEQRFKAEEKGKQLEREREEWNKEKAKLNKVILGLEADLKRMEQNSCFGQSCGGMDERPM